MEKGGQAMIVDNLGQIIGYGYRGHIYKRDDGRLGAVVEGEGMCDYPGYCAEVLTAGNVDDLERAVHRLAWGTGDEEPDEEPDDCRDYAYGDCEFCGGEDCDGDCDEALEWEAADHKYDSQRDDERTP